MSDPVTPLLLRSLTRVRAAVIVGGFFVGLGALAFAWLFDSFATSEALAQQTERVAEVTRTVTTHGQRISTVEQLAKGLAEERDFVRAQLWEIAKATGAQRVTSPPPTRTGGAP